jgi:hypothetical protein
MSDREKRASTGVPAADAPNERPNDATPGAAGHPEPGSGHDDSQLTTVDDGPPRHLTDGVPGAFGDPQHTLDP